MRVRGSPTDREETGKQFANLALFTVRLQNIANFKVGLLVNVTKLILFCNGRAFVRLQRQFRIRSTCASLKTMSGKRSIVRRYISLRKKTTLFEMRFRCRSDKSLPFFTRCYISENRYHQFHCFLFASRSLSLYLSIQRFFFFLRDRKRVSDSDSAAFFAEAETRETHPFF